MSGGNYFWRKFCGEGAIFRGAIILRHNFPGAIIRGEIIQEAIIRGTIIQGAIFLGCNCPRTPFLVTAFREFDAILMAYQNTFFKLDLFLQCVRQVDVKRQIYVIMRILVW